MTGEAGSSLRELVGALADETRLRAFAAVTLGADTGAEIASRSGLSRPAARRALARLVSAGLVREEGAVFEAVPAAFAEAARRAKDEGEAAGPHSGDVASTPEQNEVLRRFMRAGRVTAVPARPAQRHVLLDYLAGHFTPGTRYPEKDVNALLGRYHADTATLRRLLVDEGFLERDHGLYWRSGGTFEVD